MSTTSLKLPDDVKERVAAAARSQGVSAHAFMVEAIHQAAAAAERRAEFLADAQAAREAALASGQGFAAADVHAYLRERVAGKRAAKRPAQVSWPR
ncbi:MAG TPA: CopG family transcriptional regulator [Ideonella sp.]|nr:CopG family transcriptional regulator [Ideonella sp.]